MNKKVYRVEFNHTWNGATVIENIVVTSNIEKSIERLRKRLEGGITIRSSMLGKAADYITLKRVELIGKATVHA